MSGTRIDMDELQVLMNLLPEERMAVSYPPYGFDILQPRPEPAGYTLDIPRWLGFSEAISRFPGFEWEMPDYRDFRECMLSSGILEFVNQQDIRESVANYRKMQREVRFSLDTNMMFNNFVRNHDIITPSEMVLVDTSLEEIKNMLNRKYAPRQISALAGMAGPAGALMGELSNQRMKATRKAMGLAHAEWNHISTNGARIIKAAVKYSPENNDCDKIIVDTLKAHDMETSEVMVLLTSDEPMTDLCKANGIEYIKCDLPHRTGTVDCDFRQFNKLVFVLAKVFGFIKVGPAVIYGVYGGYSSNDDGALKVVTDNPELHLDLERELGLCRRLKGLGIGR